MPSRQARLLPQLFLMTDERMGDALWAALERLPRGAGVVFRHYGLAPQDRRKMFERVRAVTRRRRLVLVLAGSERLALRWRADGIHGPSPHSAMVRPMLRTAPAHNRKQLIAAERAGRDLVFVSPIHATRSHRGAEPLGRVRAGLMLGNRRDHAVALGGMTMRRARSLRSLGIMRWAAIDAWLDIE